ncbi:MAG: DUF488 domain-containing protein [Treponema sp.]|nr:DUF488 domain-containing protein [Treponema sp.]MBD5413316.1 DUF488 domain-containing protein [Treponema sp.]
MDNINLFTIGFAKKDAKTFFSLLKENGVKKLIDVRLNNVSQLAGFTKQDDLKYFLNELCDIDYYHFKQFAPTEDILKRYKKKEISWKQYEMEFNVLIAQRRIENEVPLDLLNNSCLLCSEPTAEKCHRRLVAEYFCKFYPQINIIHL